MKFLRPSLEHDVAVLADFYCGQQEMDNFIHTRLSSFLTAYNCRFYVVRNEEQKIVAMFVLSTGKIFLDDDCKEDLIMKFPEIENSPLKDYWEAGLFPSIEIDYFAVHKDFRNKHIGSTLIDYIESFHTDDYFNNPLFISVDAYCTTNYSAVQFYDKCRFWASEIKSPAHDTLRMYRAIAR